MYLEALDTREVPAVVTWDGARNGGLSIDNLGYIGDNWVGGEVPSAGDDILIPATSGDLFWDNVSLGSVTIEAGWDRDWDADGVTINGDSVMRDATIILTNNNFTIASTSILTASGISFKLGFDGSNPKVFIEATSTLRITANQFARFEVNLENLGNIQVAEGGSVTLGEDITFWNRQSLTFAGNGGVRNAAGGGTLENTGFVQQTGAGRVEFEPYVRNSWLMATGGPTSEFQFLDTSETESIWNTGILRLGAATTMKFGTNGLYSSGGEIQTLGGNLNIATTTGKMVLSGTLIQLGYNSNSGKCVLFADDISLQNCTLNLTLNWANDSMDRLRPKNATLNGSNTINIRQVDRPATLPLAPHTFTVVEADTSLTGDFTGWGIADLTHGKTGNRIWLGVPPPPVPIADPGD